MKIEKKDMLLYAVTDRHWLRDNTLVSQVEEAIKGGATFIQLREKHMERDAFLKEAIQIKELCRKYKVPFVINDNVEIAFECDADGVHVGQSDMEVGNARKILGPDKIIGVSAHSVEEALLAESRGADYLGVGAAFQTGTKTDANVLDRKVIRDICEAVKIPVIAIGGINEENISKLGGSGICGVAVISAIFASNEIEKTTRRLKESVTQMLTKE